MKYLKLFIERFRAKQINVRLRKSGHMTNQEMTMALSYSRDCSLMRTLEEIRSRLEDEIMENAFSDGDPGRLKALSRIEGINEFFKNIMIFRDAAEESGKQQ